MTDQNLKLTIAPGFLTRLARDRRGNTLVMVAAFMVPILGFAGSAVDMTRLYVVKVRLQQACDAGALAGRKGMTDTTTKTTLDATASAQAQMFFTNNFRNGWLGTSNTVFTPTKASVGSGATVANAVNGTASVAVPMTVMAMFGAKTTTVSVTCQAIYDLADTDVMFVLDTTGSMSGAPTGGGNGKKLTYTRDDGISAYYNDELAGSKVEALRKAVLLFDQTMTENKQSDTIVRYGFAPYSTVVNVGKLLPSSSVSTNLAYNTRWVDGDYPSISNVVGAYPITQVDCLNNRRTPGWSNSYRYQISGQNYAVAPTYSYVGFTGTTNWAANNGGTCTGTGGSVRRPLWRYGTTSLPVNDYALLNTVPTPGRINGATSKWRGCVEMTGKSNASSFDANSLPSDLDPDVMPPWRPMWPEVVWYPQGASSGYPGLVRDQDVNANYNYGALSAQEQADSVTCPMEAQTLKAMSSSEVNNYLYANNFKAAGNTYHDYGMAWGLRMLSLKGPFAATVKAVDGRKQPSQNIVFMTDGDPVADLDNYQMYGVEGLDGNMADKNATQEKTNHQMRLRVLCDAAKLRGITVYMIAFGTALTDDMKYCASPGQSFTASNNAALQDAFAAIAKRIAMLRVNQ
ncbi:TadE/TadG family type IV pilus assembly protein [Sphingomonas aerophila]|uniref:Flp pilus assembly protein TadG n=1 Tax=Sphingomonas aerophila TaxID=1344948 RepID=A0A7W9EVV5_9SPHN|nr:TadE/TadG family type IV pilus assembly protein [Sphingomonas aerophila]MBB5714878.1 Flp pilus assembly protein TadG [Sphingomonas aerophila]